MVLRNYADKVKQYFWFSHDEWKSFIFIVITFAFIASFGEWGGARFDQSEGLHNLFIALILVSITVLIHHAAQRLVALKLGLRAEQSVWWYGAIIGLMLAVLSRGKIAFLAATSTLATILPIHRLGAFRYGANLATIGKIVLAGPAANLLFAWALLLLTHLGIIGGAIVGKLFTLNLLYAWWNLLPIPLLDGSKIFFWSRGLYIVLFATLSTYVGFAVVLGYQSFAISMLVSAVIGFLMFNFFNKKEWV